MLVIKMNPSVYYIMNQAYDVDILTWNIGRMDVGRGREGDTGGKEWKLNRKRNCSMAFHFQAPTLVSTFAP